MTGPNSIARLVARHAFLGRELDLAESPSAALKTVIDYFLATGVRANSLKPLMVLYGAEVDRMLADGKGPKPGAPPMAGYRRLSLAACAATITALKDRGAKVDEAVPIVAAASGFQEKELRGFRENISRGKASIGAADAYREMLAELRRMPDDEFQAVALRRISDLSIC